MTFMENPSAMTLTGSGLVGVGSSGLDSVQFGEEIHRLMMTVPPENASSFTALLELPAIQALELLHHAPDPDGAPAPAKVSGGDVGILHQHSKPYPPQPFGSNLTFLSDPALIERAAKFSVFAGEHSPETTSSVPSNSSANLEKVKNEPMETDSNPNSSQPLVSDPMVEEEEEKEKEKNQRPSVKRKEREKKVSQIEKKKN